MRPSTTLAITLLLAPLGCVTPDPTPPPPPAAPVAPAFDSGAPPETADATVEVGDEVLPESAAPGLSIDTAAIDFGPLGCGAPAPPSRTLSLTWHGADPVAWSVEVADSKAFSIAGATNGSLADGASVAVQVSAAAFAASTSAGASEHGRLVVRANGAVAADVPLSVAATGGTLGLQPQSIDFGQVPLGAPATDIALTLRNTGDAPLTVTPGAPTDAQFSLAWPGAPGALVVPAGGMASGLVAHFTPSGTSPAAATIPLNVSGPQCGSSVASVPLTGQGTNGKVGLEPGSLDFGATACGAVAAAQTVTVRNTGTGAFTFTAALGSGTWYAVQPTSGSVGPGENVSLTVTPVAVPGTSLTTPDLYADSLVVTTTAVGDAPHTIALHQTARGARLVASRGSIAFGDVPVSASQSAPLSFENDGNSPVSVSLSATGADYAVTPTAVSAIAAGATLSASVGFSPTVAVSRPGAVHLTQSGGDPLCAPLPADVTLSGAGTSGAIALSAASLDFGQVACGAQAVPQNLVVRNSGNAAFHFSAALGRGAQSPFTFSSASGTVAAGGSTTLTVTPRAVPSTASIAADAFGDTLTVTTDIVGDAPHAVALHETARGGILRLSQNKLDFGDVPLGTSSSSALTIFNDGNAPVRVSTSGAGSDFAFIPGSPYSVSAGGQSALSVRFSPTVTTAQSNAVSLSVGAGDVLCAPAPGLSLAGRGTNGAVALSATSLDFGAIACGARASAQTLVVTNGGTAPFTFSAAISGTPTLPYAVTISGSTTLGPGAQASVVVTPPAVPQTSSVQAGLYDGVLRVTTNVFGDSPHDVALRLSARGAILAVNPTSIAFGNVAVGTTATASLGVSNSGNAPAAVSFAVRDAKGAPTSIFTIDPQGQTVSGGAGLSLTASFVSAYGGNSATATMTVPTGTPLCAPLPAAVPLSGTGVRGIMAISPTSVDFGEVCGSTNPALNRALIHTVTLTNSGNASLTWNGSALGGRFSVKPASGTLAAGAQIGVQLAPNDVTSPTGKYSDTFRVTDDVPNDTAHDVALTAAADGAVYVFTPGSITLNVTTQRLGFVIQNTGNAPSAPNGLTLSMTTGSSTWLAVTPTGVSPMPAGGSGKAVAEFFGSNAPTGTFTGGIQMAPNGAESICAARPVLQLTATK